MGAGGALRNTWGRTELLGILGEDRGAGGTFRYMWGRTELYCSYLTFGILLPESRVLEEADASVGGGGGRHGVPLQGG